MHYQRTIPNDVSLDSKLILWWYVQYSLSSVDSFALSIHHILRPRVWIPSTPLRFNHDLFDRYFHLAFDYVIDCDNEQKVIFNFYLRKSASPDLHNLCKQIERLFWTSYFDNIFLQCGNFSLFQMAKITWPFLSNWDVCPFPLNVNSNYCK